MTPDPTPEQIAESMVFYDKLGIHVQDAPVALPGGGTFAQRSVQLFPPRGFEDERGLKDVVRSLRAIVVAALRRRAEVEAGRWIPVSERLPERGDAGNEPFIVAGPLSTTGTPVTIGQAYFDPDRLRWHWGDCVPGTEDVTGDWLDADPEHGWTVTHWQPLPAPPAPAAGQAAARGEYEGACPSCGFFRSDEPLSNGEVCSTCRKVGIRPGLTSYPSDVEVDAAKRRIREAMAQPAPTPSPEVPAAPVAEDDPASDFVDQSEAYVAGRTPQQIAAAIAAPVADDDVIPFPSPKVIATYTLTKDAPVASPARETAPASEATLLDAIVAWLQAQADDYAVIERNEPNGLWARSGHPSTLLHNLANNVATQFRDWQKPTPAPADAPAQQGEGALTRAMRLMEAQVASYVVGSPPDWLSEAYGIVKAHATPAARAGEGQTSPAGGVSEE